MSIPSIVIHKFGGVALADAEAMRHAASIIAAIRDQRVVVVASAMGGVTDELLRIATLSVGDGVSLASELRDSIARLEQRHLDVATTLSSESVALTDLTSAIRAAHEELLLRCKEVARDRALSPRMQDTIVVRGEQLAARLLTCALCAAGVRAELVDATRIVHTDGRHGNATPDLARTSEAVLAEVGPLLERGIVPVVPGYIGAAPQGEVVTLGRGGSDLTATLLARVLQASEIVLWKDVPGMLTADPRVVPNARLIPSLHVREAAELAYYGARVLHPRALIGLQDTTRMFIRPLADPTAHGTEISARKPAAASARFPVKALAGLPGQAVVTITGNGMAGVPGIAARAFGALEDEGISVSFIAQASSEHSICMGIPGASADAAETALKDAFENELARAEIEGIEVREGSATLAIVGLGMAGHPGIAAKLFGALAVAGVNIIAIAQGASELNISLVVDEKDAGTAQRAAHDAFHLDKIGGGTAEHATHADVVILGFGQIGRELAASLVSLPKSGAVRVVGIIDRSGYLFDARGLGAKRLATVSAAKRGGTPIAEARGGKRATAAEAIEAITAHALSRPMLVDVTADDTGALLAAAASAGMDLVLANKRPLAAEQAAADALLRRTMAHGRRVLHEATVGAGLPIIDTIHKLLESGDQILRIEGCPSGTLGYLFGELGRGVPFSTALRAAMALGYTEPDPRDDLSGMDVARKALILARLIGYSGELADIDVESLVPASLRDVPLAEFLGRLEEMDAEWRARVDAATDAGGVLRYRAGVTSRRARVGVVTADGKSSFASLNGTDNQFVFTTKRYRNNPLVITGPGAGVQVTAAGVLNDVLKLARTR